jgi:hypothetical protein
LSLTSIQIVAGQGPVPAFLAVESGHRITAKSAAPYSERKPPEIFCRNFIIRPLRSARLLVNGMLGSVRKRRTSDFRGIHLRSTAYA